MTQVMQQETARATEEPAVVKKRNTRPYIILGSIVGVGLVAYFGYQALTAGKESTDDAQVATDLVPLAARVSGTVVELPVTDNQLVKKDDLIVKIDPTDYLSRQKQAEAELAAANAQAVGADAQVKITESGSRGGLSSARAALSGSASSAMGADAQIAAAQAALDHARADASKAETDLQRAQTLRKDDAIPQAQVDTALTTAAAARAAVAQAQAQVAASQDAKATAQTRVAEAQGRVEQSTPVDAQLAVARANAALAHARADSAQAALDLAKTQLANTRIVAPFDGHVSRLGVHIGQLVSVSQVVTSVLPLATYVVANFKETQVGGNAPGAIRDRHGRCAARSKAPCQGGERLLRHGGAVLAPSPRQRIGQLRQGGPARSREAHVGRCAAERAPGGAVGRRDGQHALNVLNS